MTLLVFTAYVLLCVGCAALQRRMIYFPPVFDREKADKLGAAANLDRWVGPHGESLGWKRSAPAHPSHGSVFILHGNAGCAVWCAHYADAIQSVANLDVFIAEYPGYADRPGKPTERTLEESSDEAFRFLPANDPIYLVGESLGTGIASYLAGAHPHQVSGVVLLAPFTSLTDVAQAHAPILPVRLILRDCFPSEERLRKYHGPIAVLVADGDSVVPARFGRRLYDGYEGPKRLWAFAKGDHETVMEQPLEIWKEIVEFWPTNSAPQPAKQQ